jgi:hypothetical protein
VTAAFGRLGPVFQTAAPTAEALTERRYSFEAIKKPLLMEKRR